MVSNVTQIAPFAASPTHDSARTQSRTISSWNPSRWRSLKAAKTRLEMELDVWTFRICWIVVLLLHLCDMAFLSATVWLYHWALTTPAVFNDGLTQLHFSISFATLGRMMWVFAGVVALHVLVVSRHLLETFRARRMRFFTLTPSTKETSGPTIHRVTKTSFSYALCLSCWNGMVRVLSAIYDGFQYVKVSWIDPVCSIHGKYFDQYFMLHEIIEMTAQIYQAYQMSLYIATRWINNVVVAMIVLNCLSSPIIRVLVPASNAPLRRLTNLMVSTLLNFINSVVIPLLVFREYIAAWDTTTNSFPIQYVWDDVWFVKGLRENQQLWVTSVLDFLTTLAPHLSMLDCLWTCANIVRRQHSRPSPRAKMIGKIPVHPSSRPGEDVTTASGSLSSAIISKSPWIRRLESLVYNAFWLSGLVVLGLHVQAQLLPQFPDCRLAGTPWFVQQSSCALAEVNCHRFMVEGNEMQVDFLLSQLNSETILTLTFLHCPQLQIPPRIRNFRGILNFEIYNCTIDEWSEEASIQTGFFPWLLFINIVRTNLSMVPPGLSNSISDHVGQIVFHETNLTTLPPQIETSWASVVGLGFEYCMFEQIPEVLYRMQASTLLLTLKGNPITNWSDDEVFNLGDLVSLSLAKTSLTQLPAHDMAILDHVFEFPLEFTQLTSVPSYIREWYAIKTEEAAQGMVPFSYHSLFGTPYCASELSDEASVDEQTYKSQVCSEELLNDYDWYPMDVMEPQRQL